MLTFHRNRYLLVCVSLMLASSVITSCSPTAAATPTAAPADVRATTAPADAPTASPAPATLATPTLVAKVPRSAEDLQRIEPEELLALIEGGADIVVVDNQPEVAYDSGHIPGAINFPWAETVDSPGDLPKDKLMVFYCACSHEEDAIHMSLQLIKKFGYTKIMLLDGGWLRWMELGYPSEVKE